MVATLLRLRLATTVHQLRREWWRRLVLIGGAVWSLSLFPLIAAGAVRLRWTSADGKADVLLALFVVLLIGWIVVPLLITGIDDTLEPGRFAIFGVSARRLMPGLTASAFLTIPALFFLAALMMLAGSWRRHGGDVYAVGLVGVLFGVATLVFTARVATAWSGRLLQSRRSRAVALSAAALIVVSAAPVVYVLVADGLELVLEYDVRIALDILGNTPFGAPMRAPAEAALGNWWGAAWRLAMSGVWVLLLWLAWRANVAHSLVHPVYRGGGGRRRGDAVLAAAEGSEDPVERATRAVAARARRYWFSDPRLLVGLISVAAFPLLFFVLLVPVFGSPLWLIVAIPVLLAGTLGWGRHNDVAYDSSALWLDVVSGSLGRSIMAGRLRAVLFWASPLLLATAVGAVSVAGRFDLLPAVLGATVGVAGTSLGVASVSSVLLPYRAPQPGGNPFGAEVGSVGASLFAQFVSSVASWAVALPVTLPLVAALLWNPAWGWLGLALGLGVGATAALLGVRWSGTAYDQRAGRLLSAVA